MLINFLKKSIIGSNKYLIFLDQIIVSGSNFLISIIILRFLGTENFGIFSFYFLFLNLILGLQISYIISPMLTNASKQNNSEINLFYGSVFIQQIFFTFLISIFFFILSIFFKDFNEEYKLGVYSFQFLLILITTQFHQFIRRLLLSKKYYCRALIGDLVTYISLITSLLYLNSIKLLTLYNIWWLFFYTFLIGIIFNFSVLFSLNFKFNYTLHVIKTNWIIGKWLLVTSLTQWFSGNLWLINAGIILGPFNFGIIRACQTILNVLNIIFQSIENFAPSEVSEKFYKGGIYLMDKYLKKFTMKYFIVIFLITIFIILFSKNLLNFFYGNEISEFYYILISLSFITPIHFLQYPLNYKFRTLSNTSPIFISFVASAIFALIFSKLIITNFLVEGLIFGLYGSQIIVLLVLHIINRVKNY